MPIVVRAASGADFDTLITLNQVVQSLHAALYPSDFKPVADPAAVKALFATHIDAPESGIGIAEIDRAPAGYVFFEVQARFQPRSTSHVWAPTFGRCRSSSPRGRHRLAGVC